MSEQENRATLERVFQALDQQDLDTIYDLLHEDFVEEHPQSGEKIRGKDNWRKIADNYPGGLPSPIDYTFKNRVYICDVFEMQDGLIKTLRAYFGEPFEAPEWRAQWVERM